VSSIQTEYDRFLAELSGRQVSENVRRLANLVRTNLAQLATVGAVRRARSVRLAPLAITGLNAASPDLAQQVAVAAGTQLPGRLQRLDVGPFRGFTRQEAFDLSHPITLVQGANGTGKSSFCEALETAMLGSITEAQAKRIDHRQYCNNARLGHHQEPRLWARGPDGIDLPVRADAEAFRFCFIEKNRLDDFGRIAARTPGDQRQLIATLFGVDQFAEFVRGFNASLDENLGLSDVKAQELAVLRNQVSLSQQVIDGYEQALTDLAQQESELAEEFRPGNSFETCQLWLLGGVRSEGRLPELTRLLEEPVQQVFSVTTAGLNLLREARNEALGKLNETNNELAARAGEVSYAQLYDAVLEIMADAKECPACGTPLDRVVQDPLERAEDGLRQLKELTELEAWRDEYERRFADAERSLLLGMRGSFNASVLLFADKAWGAQLPELPQRPLGEWFNAWIENEGTAWNSLLELTKQVEAADEVARVAAENRQSLITERRELEPWRTRFESMRLTRESRAEQLRIATFVVAEFEAANQALIQEVAAEAETIRRHTDIKAAYDGFLPELQAYLAGLPQRLLHGLSDQAKNLYNMFNRDDPPGDLLHALVLPLVENGKIEVEFMEQPGTRYDALLILSEGHIKCLGLAILLAKNLAQNCPFVIFDDVVNAIDDDHRNGIWRTFFESGLLDQKQVILTSHAEEFIHRIQQELGAARARDIKRFKFLTHLGEHELRIDTDPPSKNYIVLARQSLDQDEKRDALRQARAAIESLTDRIWRKLDRYTNPRLELKLAGPGANIELNNKCAQLRSVMRRLQNVPPAIVAFQGALDQVLGIRETAIEWHYLNGGTHDSQRRQEFDRAAVRTIIEAAEAMDQALAQLQASR
jgi:hypothetical protein